MKIEMEIAPFLTPNYVRTLSETDYVKGYPLSDLSAETISELCDQFRHDVFMKAGKVDPRIEK